MVSRGRYFGGHVTSSAWLHLLLHAPTPCCHALCAGCTSHRPLVLHIVSWPVTTMPSSFFCSQDFRNEALNSQRMAELLAQR